MTAPTTTAEPVDHARYRLVAVTDEVLDCDACGLPLDRERVYLIEDRLTEQQTYAGTTCGARLLKTTVSRFRTAVAQQEREQRQAEHRAAEQARLRAYLPTANAIIDAAMTDTPAWKRRSLLAPATSHGWSERLATTNAARIVDVAVTHGERRPPYGPFKNDDAKWAGYLLRNAVQCVNSVADEQAAA